jgi:hypothetical protein
MIILDTTTRSLEVVLDAVPNVEFPFVASYVSLTTTTYTPGTTTGATNGTTAVTLVAAPGAATQRQVKLLTLYNASNGTRTVTVRLNDNGTMRTMGQFALLPGNTLVYTDGEGWRVLDSTGAIKQGAVDAGGKQHWWIEASHMSPRITNGPSRGYTELPTNKVNVETLDFDQTTIEYAQFARKMPGRWDLATITHIPVWTAAAGTGTSKFALRAVAVSDGDAIDTAFGTPQISEDTLLAVNAWHAGPESSAITVAGNPAAGDGVLFEVYRDTSDTLNADSKLIGLLIVVGIKPGSDA